MYLSSRKGFTLIELLVVIAIIAILAVVVVLTLNPAELLKQSRDANRVSDMATLTNALNFYNTDQGGSQAYFLGSASTAYVSIPDPTATSTAGDQCQGLGMPSLPSGSYHCAEVSAYRSVNGTGWIPVNFSAISNGSPFGSLPVDPTNQTSSNLFYTYQTNGTQFETTAVMESQKYQSLASSSGGPYSNLYVKGSNLTLALTDYANGVVTVATGTVSQANVRLGLTSNTSFVDFSTAGALTPYIGDELIITDHSGNQLVGWIKDVGRGETYGPQLLQNPSLTTTTGIGSYNSTPSIISSGGQSGGAYMSLLLTANYGNAWQFLNQNGGLTYGMLFKDSVYCKVGTETLYPEPLVVSNASGTNLATAGYQRPTSWTLYTLYATADSNSAGGFAQGYESNDSGETTFWDTASATQVLTPSTTGVTIVSSAGGSTYNWTSEQSGFNLNDSNGYTYSIVL